MMIGRDNDAIGNDVINVVGSHGARITEVIHLNWGWSASKNARACARGESLKIDCYVYFQVTNTFGDFHIGLHADVNKSIE